jgi:hypothetical protein
MEKNMSALQPRTLTNQELIKYFAMYMEDNEFGAPVEWQIELLRRFTAVAPDKDFPLRDPNQLDLFS